MVVGIGVAPGYAAAAARPQGGSAAVPLPHVGPDRTVLPIAEPAVPLSNVLDVRNAPAAPPPFRVAAPKGA